MTAIRGLTVDDLPELEWRIMKKLTVYECPHRGNKLSGRTATIYEVRENDIAICAWHEDKPTTFVEVHLTRYQIGNHVGYVPRTFRTETEPADDVYAVARFKSD